MFGRDGRIDGGSFRGRGEESSEDHNRGRRAYPNVRLLRYVRNIALVLNDDSVTQEDSEARAESWETNMVLSRDQRNTAGQASVRNVDEPL